MTYVNHTPQSTCNGLAGGAQSEAYAPRKPNSKPTVSLALRALVLNNEALTLVLQMLKFLPEGQILWKRTSSRDSRAGELGLQSLGCSQAHAILAVALLGLPDNWDSWDVEVRASNAHNAETP